MLCLCFQLIYSCTHVEQVRFKSSVSFGAHTLLNKSLRVLQLPTHLSSLTANG